MVPLNLSVSLSLTNRTLLILSYNKIKIFIILKFVYWKVIEQALQLTSYYWQTVHFLLGSFSIDNGNKTSVLKWILVFSIVVAFIPICWKWPM